MSVRSPTAGTWSSSPWRPANEFEMDRRGSADRAAVDGGRGPLNGRVAGHYGPIIPRFASVSGSHAARRQAHRRPTARDPAASAEPATAPPKATQIATGGAGGRHRRRRPDATQRCFNPEFSERIGNSRRTGSSPADAIRHWSAEGGHPIQDLTAEDGLTPLPGWAPGAKAISDDGLVAEERVLHPALTMVP